MEAVRATGRGLQTAQAERLCVRTKETDHAKNIKENECFAGCQTEAGHGGAYLSDADRRRAGKSGHFHDRAHRDGGYGSFGGAGKRAAFSSLYGVWNEK